MAEGSSISRETVSHPIGVSFDQQFDQGRRRYESLGGVINAVFVKPEQQKTAVPVVIAPGWGENKDVFKKCIEALYNNGRSVIALDQPRRGGTIEPQENYPIDELRKALTIQTIVQQEKLPKIDLITHSEGSINGAIAASLMPDKVRNMVLFNPAGLIGKDTVPRLLGRFILKNVYNTFHTLGDKDAMQQVLNGQNIGAKYFLQNPARAYQEVRAISQSEIEEMLKNLHDQGIGITIIHGVDDKGFPMEKMQQIVKSATNPGGFVDGFLSVKGGHDELYIHPDIYTNAAEQMLSALENKSQ